MAESMMSEVTTNLTKSLSDSTRAFTDGVVAVQERNLRSTQRVLETGLDVLKSNRQNTQDFTQVLVEQSQKQQEIFQHLTHEAVEAYSNLVGVTFSSYRQMLGIAESMTRQSVDAARKLTQEGMDVAHIAQGHKATK